MNEQSVDTCSLIAVSDNFQADLKDFTESTCYLVKGNVHTRTSEDGNVRQVLSLDSASTQKVQDELAILDDEALSLFKAAGVSEDEIVEIMGDSIDVGNLAVAGILFSSLVHDEYVMSNTRSSARRKYLTCALEGLGLDLAAVGGTAIKMGVKAAVKMCARVALTGASGGVGLAIFAIGYTLCINDF